MKYLLDANVFIQAKNLHYGLDFCPAFWDWLIQKNKEEKVFSIEKVQDEIKAGDDELTDWAANFGEEFFLKPDEGVFPSFRIVSEWVEGQKYHPSAPNAFFQGADYYLVAQALTTGFTVVTHEIVSNSMNRIKIPNVCIGLGVKFMTPYQMLRIERARFVLGKSKSES